MKITNRQIDSNKEQISRQITETWTTADGKQRIVTVNAETTGAEEWTTQTTAWRVYIMNKKNPNDTFLHKTTHNGGCQGEMNLLPVLEETRLARTEARENRNPDEPVQADDATRDTKLRDLIDKDDYQYEEIPADMTVGELRDKMKAGEQYYDICPVDSVIRETHFLAIAAAHGIDYTEPYENRLKH